MKSKCTLLYRLPTTFFYIFCTACFLVPAVVFFVLPFFALVFALFGLVVLWDFWRSCVFAQLIDVPAVERISLRPNNE
ncbi:hypothetical protein PENSPDRAFT_440411 [Peniophora sp. CONT]|nr:hypothetical protein PENSPDRAFT_440411 [Peniophora sp. CONT]